MKAVILAGGRGTRLMEETRTIPKPMVTIGEEPMLLHIIRSLASQGIREFIICLGYKGDLIKEYFMNYKAYNSNFKVDLSTGSIETEELNELLDVTVSLIDTGLNTNTAGRVNRIKDYVKGETFLLTYGDGVSDINLENLMEIHKDNNALLTNANKLISSRFGSMELDGNRVVSFTEKSENSSRINIGYFICEPDVFNYMNDYADKTQWENGPVVEIANAGRMYTYEHKGFWQCMDSLRDKEILEELWKTNPLWKKW
jgi:glucose-1-phosphate cytidylyltransferase